MQATDDISPFMLCRGHIPDSGVGNGNPVEYEIAAAMPPVRLHAQCDVERGGQGCVAIVESKQENQDFLSIVKILYQAFS